MMRFTLLPCAYKSLFGISCPMCGFLRSLLLLARGEVWQSMLMFPPLFPLIVVLSGGLVLWLLGYRVKTKTRWLIVGFIACSFLLNCVLKNMGV